MPSSGPNASPDVLPRAAGRAVASLANAIDEVLGRLIAPGEPCALIDFPNHSNIGDSAIWLGESRWLRSRGCPIVYACDVETYSASALSAAVQDGPILLHGGGNLGDFWAHHQKFREYVIESFPNNRIVQLSQTIYFMNEWGAGEAARVFNAHKNLTVLCRDPNSLAFARKRFAARSHLCPDMAFALGPLLRPAESRIPILWLGRTDAEAAGPQTLPAGDAVLRTDWLDEEPSELHERFDRLRADVIGRPADGVILRSLMDVQDPVAQERLRRGCVLLSQGEVVITDRLHGHILCLLLGIPHVVLDNSYGKVGRFFEAWTRECGIAEWADSPDKAVEIAHGMLAAARARRPERASGIPSA